MRYVFLILCYISVIDCSFSQSLSVSWLDAPQARHHFYGIMEDDSAAIRYRGIAICGLNNKPQNASVFLYKNNIASDTFLFPINFQGDTANIVIDIKIKGEIAFYTSIFKIGNITFIADSIKAGISILCSGQSNMVASFPQTNTLTNIPLDPYIASFGYASSTATSATNISGLKFNFGNPNSAYSNGSIGLVAFNLAQALKDSLHLPICVINGALGGSALIEHLKTSSSYIDSTTIYGRLLYRVRKAGLEDEAIRAFFWYQGEADVNINHSTYISQFQQFSDSLRKDFGEDLPIFITQIRRQTCANSLDGVLRFQELQRHLPNIQGIIATNALMLGSDNCHFTVDAYQKLGTEMARLFFAYQKNIPTNNIFPQIINAQLTTNPYLIKVICSAPIDTLNLAKTKSLLRVSNTNNNLTYPIANLSAKQDTILLHFDTAPSNLQNLQLSYLGTAYQDSAAILAKTGGTLLCFYNVPIQTLAPKIFFKNTNNPQIVVCEDSSFLIQTQTQNVYQYFWYKNGVLLNQQGNEWEDTIFSGEHNYTLRVSYAQNGNLSAFSNILTIRKSEPIALIVADGNTTFCANTPTLLHSLDTTVGNVYIWKKSNTLMQTGALHFFSPNTDGSYFLTVIDSHQCAKTSNPVEIVIKPIPDIDAGTDRTLCRGYNTLIGSAIQSNFTYSWSPTTNMNDNYIAEPNVSPTQNTTYYLWVTDTNTQCQNTDSVKITVIPTPNKPLLTSNNAAVCEDKKLSLYPTTNAISDINWYKNGVFWQTTSMIDSLLITEISPNPMKYNIELIGTNGCISNLSDTLSAWLKEAPKPQITARPAALNGVVEICLLNKPQRRVYFSANAAHAANFAWKLNSDYIFDENEDSLKLIVRAADNRKFVNVEVSYYNGCQRIGSPLWLNVVQNACIDTMNNAQDFEIPEPTTLLYPNPAEDKLYLEISDVVGKLGKVSIYNPLGEKILDRYIEFIASRGYEEISVATFADGIYVLILETQGNRIIHKFVKQ